MANLVSRGPLPASWSASPATASASYNTAPASQSSGNWMLPALLAVIGYLAVIALVCRLRPELAKLTESEVIGSVGRTATFFKLGADAE